MSRTHIGCKKRFQILQRDKFKCQYCGATGDSSNLEVDHIVPVSMGGTNKDENLITACHACNAGKSDGIVFDSLDDLAGEINKMFKKETGYFFGKKGKEFVKQLIDLYGYELVHKCFQRELYLFYDGTRRPLGAFFCHASERVINGYIGQCERGRTYA